MRFFRFCSLIVSLSVAFTMISCNQQVIYKDTKPPVIVVLSPSDYNQYLYVDIDIQVNEQYEAGKESGLRDVRIEIQSYPSYVLFRTNISVSGNEYRFTRRFYFTNANIYTLKVFASDGFGNNANRVVEFYLYPYSTFYVSLYNSFYATNTNLLGFHGRIYISSKEIYGDASNVVLIVSNSLGSFTNNVSYFDNTYWYLNPTVLNLENAGMNYKYNSLKVILITSSNSNTNYSLDFYYDTNRPYVVITNLTNNQVVGKLVTVVVTNYDNLGLSEGRLYMISGSTTNITNATSMYSSFSRLYKVLLDKPNYTLVPYERDVAGNEYYGSPVSVIYDASLVSISMYLPLEDFSTNFANKQILVFQGQSYVGDEYKVTNIVLMVYTNGNLVSIAGRVYNTSSVNWVITNNVFMGTNELRYFALSDSGRSSPTNYAVLLVDYIKPIAKIISPTNNSEFDVDMVKVVSYLGDTNFSLGVFGDLYVNGSHVSALFGGTNTSVVSLVRGVNEIMVVGRDFMGNYETNSITVVYGDDAVYVSPSGSDTNSGSRNRPLRTIQKGIDRAVQLGLSNVYVSVGVYTPGNGLNTNISGVVITNSGLNIVGGWSSSFTSIVGYSELDGMNNLYHVVYASNVSGVSFKNFVIRNGRATNSYDGYGGGLYLVRFDNGVLSNLIITNNFSWSGGGIYLSVSRGNSIYGHVNNNVSGDSGGGIYVLASVSNRIFANVYRNIATNYGGGIAFFGSTNNLISSSVYENTAMSEGGGILIWHSYGNIISNADIYRNASAYGGGVYIEYSVGNMITNTRIFSNYSSYHGGGVGLRSSSHNIVYGEVRDNISGISGGGIYVVGSVSNRIFANVYGNIATNGGGGIYIYDSSVNIITNARIFSNYSGFRGGGIYLTGSRDNVIYGYVNNNISGGSGGGIYLAQSVGNRIIANVYSNVATNQGGGIVLYESTNNFIYSTIYQNVSMSGTSYGEGGGILLKFSSGNIVSNSDIYQNLGGGVYFSYSSFNSLLGSRIYQNYNDYTGGGINLFASSNNLISNSLIFSNSSRYDGGGIGIQESYSNLILNCRIYLNSATNLGGGGVYILGSHNNIIRESLIYQNSSTNNGGGIFITSSSNNQLAFVSVYSNVAYNGGGIAMLNSLLLLGSYVYVSENVSTNGGGIYLSSSLVDPQIYSLFITNNTAILGGGIFVTSTTNTFTNLNVHKVDYNKARKGGGYYIESSKLDLRLSSIWNRSSEEGGGVYITNSDVSISGAVSNNISGYKGGGVAVYNSKIRNISYNLEVSHNIVSNSTLDGYGGGIYFYGITNSRFSQNHILVSHNRVITPSGSGYGGGVFVGDSHNFTNNLLAVYNNAISANNFGVGGGVAVVGGSGLRLSVINGINWNRVESSMIIGGGVGVLSNDNFTLLRVANNNVISNTTANGTNIGAGVGILSSKNVLLQEEASLNTNLGITPSKFGGGVGIVNSSNVSVFGASENIISSQGLGSGVYVSRSFDVSIVDNIYGNNLQGISILNSTNIVVSDASVEQNLGGGIYIYNSSNVVVSNSSIVFNTNSTGAGGIQVVSSGSTVKIQSNVISSNYSGNLGAISIFENNYTSSSLIEVKSNIISFNETFNTLGGGLYGSNTVRLIIEGNQFISNRTLGSSKTITLHSTRPNWSYLIIKGNTFIGVGSNPVAIWEEGANSDDIQGHSILSNTFYTNSYNLLYKDIFGVPGHIQSDPLGITLLNTVPNLNHDASSSSGNVGM